MSSLTKLLHVERRRRHLGNQGQLKTPMMMSFPIPEPFETACISLRTGDFHMVRIKPQRPTNTGFFELPLGDEDKLHGDLLRFLYEYGEQRGWGGVAEIRVPEPNLLETIETYFQSYDLECQHGFVGLIGFAAMVTAELLELPVPVEDPSTINDEMLQQWMVDYLHVGRLGDIPIYYNADMGEYLTFTAPANAVGAMTRVGDFVSILVHNGERGMIILRVGLNDHEDVSRQDSSDGAEACGEESGD